jgi:hypothetical protein
VSIPSSQRLPIGRKFELVRAFDPGLFGIERPGVVDAYPGLANDVIAPVADGGNPPQPHGQDHQLAASLQVEEAAEAPRTIPAHAIDDVQRERDGPEDDEHQNPRDRHTEYKILGLPENLLGREPRGEGHEKKQQAHEIEHNWHDGSPFDSGTIPHGAPGERFGLPWG